MHSAPINDPDYSSRCGRRVLVRGAVLIARPRLARASRSHHSIWPVTLRRSWAASASLEAATAGSRRSKNAFLDGGSPTRGSLLIQRPGVDDRLRLAFRAQYHQQVGHHRGAPLVIEIDHATFGQ